MRRPALGVLATAVGLALVMSTSAQAIEPIGDEAAAIYRPDAVDVVYLTISPASEAALNLDPEEYVAGTFSFAETDGSPDGVGTASTPVPASIRLKGQLGSKRSLAQKAAFKVKFKKADAVLGLRKLTLNNMVQDPSSIHEALTYRAFRLAGVPASRTGYAYVYVNGVDYGLHLNVENVDDLATAKRIGGFKHVYEGAYGSDVETGPSPSASEVTEAAERFEIDEGDDDLGDLEALIVAVDSAQVGDWSRRVEAFADLKEMTRMWAVEKYIGHWDGYAGVEGGYWPNNYYLQSDAEGWFRMLPWGVDQTWVDRLSFDGDAGVLFDRCLADAGCAEMYRRSLREARDAIVAADLEGMADDLRTLLQPWIAKEQANSRKEHSLQEFEDWTQGAAAFAASRGAEASAWLSEQPPEIPASEIELSLPPGPIVADGASAITATVTIVDANGDPVPGDRIVLSSTDPGQQLGPVVDNDDGTYGVRVFVLDARAGSRPARRRRLGRPASKRAHRSRRSPDRQPA